MTVVRPAYAALGVFLLAAGLAGLAAIGVAAFGTCAGCQVWALRLGLGLSTLLSGIAQGMVLTGGWLIWLSRRPGEDAL